MPGIFQNERREIATFTLNPAGRVVFFHRMRRDWLAGGRPRSAISSCPVEKPDPATTAP
ncbi:MAG: hypothetical protein HOM25_10850 [Rhodospirillaceae bacterium]|jgi:hypothetical protein|nr:hypothetical protein [Rhodospirillaceae bacterium]MBT5809238.1 hypothetical protein [Rhodospirillaceae bacterium]